MKKYIIALTALASVYPSFGITPKHLSAQALSLVKMSRDADTELISGYLTVDPGTIDMHALSGLGVKITINLGDKLTVRMPADAIAAVSDVTGVLYVEVATQAVQMLDIATEESGVRAMQRGDGERQPYTGAGVIVGIIDSGFDYGHAAFSDADGNLRIKRVWEQGTKPSDGMSSPERFGYGTELITSTDILTAAGDIENNSHGSHVTSIAAGSDEYLDGALKGNAPDAEIVLVSMTDAGAASSKISDAIAYIYQYADGRGLPCVINLSLGSNSGPHDGTSTFDVIADALQGPGRLIVGASGNHTPGASYHICHTFDNADATPIRTFIDYLVAPSTANTGSEIEIWGSKDMTYQADIVVYKLSNKEEIERVPIDMEAEGAVTMSLGRNIAGSITAVAERSPLNGKQHVVLASMVTSIRTGYAIALEIRPVTAGTVDMWAENYKLGFTTHNFDGFIDQGDASTLCEIGGTASRILTVGSYTTRSHYTLLGETSERVLDETVGDISSFSNFGPTADGRMKPQITAPGCFISAAVSEFDASGTLAYSQYHNNNGKNNYYGYMQGTSMAAPFVTGIVATWLQAWPEMTPEELVEVVHSSARTDEYTGEANDNVWGYGKIDALSGLIECITRAYGGIGSVTADDATPVKIMKDGKAVTLLFTSDLGHADISVHTITGITVESMSKTIVKAGETLTLPLPQPGIYIITVRTPHSSQTAKIQL